MSETITIRTDDAPVILNIAGPGAALALDAAARAENARDGAEIAAAAVGVFPDTGAGLAATTSGQSFYVASGGVVRLYLNNAGAAVEQAALVSSALLATTGGAGLIGTATGGTVQSDLNARPTSAALLAGDASALGFSQIGSGATQRTIRDKMREFVSVKDFGAVGDGVADDTAAIAAAIAAHLKVHFPSGTYRTTATIELRDRQVIYGDGRQTRIQAVGVSGPVIGVFGNDPSTYFYHCEVRNLNLSGTATKGLHVDFAVCLTIDNVSLDGLSCTDGFVFENTFAGQFSNLWTNGATISNGCFVVGEAFNANSCWNWYSSNTATHSLFIDGSLNSGTRPSHGSTWSACCFQSTRYGVTILNYQAGTFNGIYMEDIVSPWVLGDKASGKAARSTTINGGDFGGPYPGNPQYANRLAVFDLDYALGLQASGFEMSGAGNCGNAAVLTITDSGGPGAGAWGIARVSAAGVILSAQVISGGTGYVTPVVAIAGAGSGGAITATQSGGVVNALNVTNGGTGYVPQYCPVAIIYKESRNCAFSGQFFNPGGIQSEDATLYPWVVRKTGASSNCGVNLLTDQSWIGGPNAAAAELRKTRGASFQHVLIEADASGARVGTLYTPPLYP